MKNNFLITSLLFIISYIYIYVYISCLHEACWFSTFLFISKYLLIYYILIVYNKQCKFEESIFNLVAKVKTSSYMKGCGFETRMKFFYKYWDLKDLNPHLSLWKNNAKFDLSCRCYEVNLKLKLDIFFKI